jgi:Uncharacterized protein conserved in bacteria
VDINGENEMDNKEIVKELYKVVFNEHDLSRAGEFINEEYIQHNPGMKNGLQYFIEAFKDGQFKKNPEFKFEIKHLVAEGDYVVVHGHAIPKPGDRGVAVMDMYRLKNGKAVEHWDIIQLIPEEIANDNGMF